MEADRAHPVLARAFTPIRSFVGDGPDTLYHDAKLDESLSYEFTIREVTTSSSRSSCTRATTRACARW